MLLDHLSVIVLLQERQEDAKVSLLKHPAPQTQDIASVPLPK